MNYPTIQNHETLKRTINARDLHEALESGQKFADWIKAKVINNPFFDEAIDYVEVFPTSTNNPQGGRPSRNYALTLDTAKKVSMAEQTARGNETIEGEVAELYALLSAIEESIE